jgi:hypothetical protein
MKAILVASEYTKNTLPALKWQSKVWVTRDGKNTVYWAVADTVPGGFVLDERYNWRLDGEESAAYFTPDVLAGWHAEQRSSGQLSRKPHAVYAPTRELTIHEKLAKLAPPQPIIPQAVKIPLRHGDTQGLACRDEIQQVLIAYQKWLLEFKAAQGKQIYGKQAEVRREVIEICQSYGERPPPINLPS